MMAKRYFSKLPAGLIALSLCFASLVRADQSFTPAQLRAPFLLHIAHFTQFPDDDVSGAPVYFCFLEGENHPQADAFRGSPAKDVRQRQILLVEMDSIEAINQQPCHVLFVSQQYENEELFKSLVSLKDKTVSIGESLNFIEQGGMMSIMPMQSRMRIFFSREAFQSTELKFSSALLKRVNFR
ncbi:YfiR family protein [Aliiglaciecola sp. CAU 1673]|uniref:YfiR family protein n=1 Tax=Aliiglaciecola sp. CAU 1673 TaxID=3032595 RepID=UPI0023DA69AB|nr:YfiR family protein [Aliiglaciecola sp. CAU 1673]MDF2179116.1 YfiR family protein [Aliiglaciecola sp. CAU 1673]